MVTEDGSLGKCRLKKGENQLFVGLESKHKERDINLPTFHQSLLNEIEKDLLNDENVIAIYYGGSIGNGDTDLYSDIDLRVVVIEEKFEEYRLNKKERAKRWGKVLFYEDFPWASHSVAHYDGFLKVDSFYYTINDIQPSIWLQNIKIVHDPKGIIKALTKKSKEISYKPTIEEFEIWQSKFFAHTHEVYRGVMRSELFYALNYLDALRLAMVKGWYMEAGIQPNNPGYWAKIEGERSQLADWQLSLLEDWYSERKPSAILDVIKKMLPEFRKTNKRLCKKLKAEENTELIDKIFNLVL
jgi:predicted nucleotidyltransferase